MAKFCSFGFSTIGEPALSLHEADLLAQQFGLDFLELRALGGRIDLPAYFEHEELQSKTPIRVWGTSLRILDPATQDLEEFYRGASLAARQGVPFLRVFGGGERSAMPGRLAAAAKLVREIRENLAQRGCACELLLETHDVFNSSAACLALEEYLDEPLSLLWDSFHTWHDAHETAEESWRALGHRIRHIHYKDCDEAGRYIFPGEGLYPTQQLLELLKQEGYSGGVSLEWEKLWHPELPVLTEALPKFCRLQKLV